MANCKICVKFGDCPFRSDPYAMCSEFRQRPMTNADCIRAMSDEELAEWLGDMIYPECPCCPADDIGWCEDCHERLLDWLKEEVE